MKARRIDLTNYKPPGTVADAEEMNVREMLANLIAHPGLKLAPRDLIRHATLADTIEETRGQYIDLDEKQYDMVTKALDKIAPLVGLGRPYFPMMQRVYEAEEIEMEPKAL